MNTFFGFDAEDKRDLITEILNSAEDDSLMVGDEFMVMKTERSRSDFDKEKLKTALGSKIDEYKVRSTYIVLEVKPC